jgi:hypothetical protein
MVISQAILVVLIGIYFIRTTWFIFSGVFSPLTPVAAAVLVVCLISFHRLPTTPGFWFYLLLATCLAGAIANASLLFATSPIYSNPTNQAFSWVSMISFIVLGGLQLWSVLGHSNNS